MINIQNLILRNIAKSYKNEFVFNNVNLIAESGDLIAIKGESGIGKSTLLNILSGLELATEGEYIFNGIEMHKQSLNQLSIIRGENMGYISQYTPMISKLTAIENITLPISLKKQTTSIEKYISELTKYFKIEHLLNKKINKLSGGERQRIGIIRALLNKPKLLLADEPTASLDDDTASLVFELFKNLAENGTIIILATHSYLSTAYCNKELFLSKNGLV